MARAIVRGLLQNGYNSSLLHVVDRNLEKREVFANWKVQVAATPEAFLKEADIVCLAIKPQGAEMLCQELQTHLQKSHALILSIMAGVNTSNLNAWLGEHLAVVRAMPNTPGAIEKGATGLYATGKVNNFQKDMIEGVFKTIGITAWFDTETDLNTITALSGSGPAYYFYFMEAMQAAAEKMGIAPEIAKAFTIQTAYGAAKLAAMSPESLAVLRQQVTSKKGTTAAALECLEKAHVAQSIEAAINAAAQRALELSRNQ